MTQKTKDEYAAWLSGESFDFFFTGTFRGDDPTMNYARKSTEWFFKDSSQLAWGIVFIETGKENGRVHVHGALKYNRVLPSTQEGIRKRWDHFFGRAKVEKIRDPEAVAKYLVKYLMKQFSSETYIIL